MAQTARVTGMRARDARDRSGGLPMAPGAATARLYDTFGTTVFRYCWHMLRWREDAEDATQATFLAVHAALADGAEVRDARAWTLAIARHECLRQIARRERLSAVSLTDAPEPVDGRPGVERGVELRAEVDAAERALASLPRSQREAIVLREWLGLGTHEVALALGTSVSAVDSLLNRARAALIIEVAGSQESVGCCHTRDRLAAGSLDRGSRAHLLRCRDCRAARRALGAGTPAPRVPAVVGQRLGLLIPAFGTSGALLAKLTALPAAKTAAVALSAVVIAGGSATAPLRDAPLPERTPVSVSESATIPPVVADDGGGRDSSGPGSAEERAEAPQREPGDSSGPGSGQREEDDRSGPGGDERDRSDSSGSSGSDSSGSDSSGSSSSGSGSSGSGSSGSGSSGSGSGDD